MGLHRLNLRWAYLIASMGLGIATTWGWIHFTGPHVDTVFEFNRLYQAESYVDFLNLVAQDNQPPLAGSLFWSAYQVTGHLASLRFVTGLVAYLSLAFIGAAFIRWWSRRLESQAVATQQVAHGDSWWIRTASLFLVLVGVSPAVGATLVMMRYSTLLMVLWLASATLLARVTLAPARAWAVALGLTVGASLLTSFSSVALVVWVFGTLLWKSRSMLKWTALGSLPGLTATVAWTMWAGEQFVERVATKPVDSVRAVVATVWELVTWPLVGPAAQPGLLSILLFAIGCTAVALIYIRASRPAQALITTAFVGAGVALVTYVLVALNNGSMTGPALFIFVGVAIAITDSRIVYMRIASITLVAVALCATVMTWNRISVLRPMHFSSASDEVRRWIEEQSWRIGEVLFLDGNEFGTVLHPGLTPATPVIMNYDSVRNLISDKSEVVVVRGDDRNADERNLAWDQAVEELNQQDFQVVQETRFGRYSDVEVRRLLGLYNVQDAQYVVYVFERRS